MKRKVFTILIVCMMILSAVSCAVNTETGTTTPTTTTAPTAKPTDAPTPTEEEKATDTPTPTEEEKATDTPTPTTEPTPAPTTEPTAAPTETPKPTEEAKATETPKPTVTTAPMPTATIAPTPTVTTAPTPTVTTAPTPKPTAVSTPTLKPTPKPTASREELIKADAAKREAHARDDWKKLLPPESERVKYKQKTGSQRPTVGYSVGDTYEVAPFDEKHWAFLDDLTGAYVDLLGKTIYLEEDLILAHGMAFENGTIVTKNGASIYNHGKLTVINCEIRVEGGAFVNYGEFEPSHQYYQGYQLHVSDGIGFVNYGNYWPSNLQIYCDGDNAVGFENRVAVEFNSVSYLSSSIYFTMTGKNCTGLVNYGTIEKMNCTFAEIGEDSTAVVNYGEMSGTLRNEAMKSGVFFDNYGTCREMGVLFKMGNGTGIHNHSAGTLELQGVTGTLENGCGIYNEGVMDTGNLLVDTVYGCAIDNYGTIKTRGIYVNSFSEKPYTGTLIHNHKGAAISSPMAVHLFNPDHAYGIYNEGTIHAVDDYDWGELNVFLGWHGQSEEPDYIDHEKFYDMGAVSSCAIYNAAGSEIKDANLGITVFSKKDSYGLYCADGSKAFVSGRVTVTGNDATGVCVEKNAVAEGDERYKVMVMDGEDVLSGGLVGIQNKGTVRRANVYVGCCDSKAIVNDGVLEGLSEIGVSGNNSMGIVNNGSLTKEEGRHDMRLWVEGENNTGILNTGTVMIDLELRMGTGFGYGKSYGENGTKNTVGVYNKGTMQIESIDIISHIGEESTGENSIFFVNAGDLTCLHNVSIEMRASGLTGLKNESTGTAHFKWISTNANKDSIGVINYGVIEAERIAMSTRDDAVGFKNYGNSVTCSEFLCQVRGGVGVYNEGQFRVNGRADFEYMKGFEDSVITGSGTFTDERHYTSQLSY